jgi:hypothetical protein
MTTIPHDTHGRIDGLIDIDRYRANATAMRRQALRDGKVLRTACAGVLAMTAAMAVALLIAAAPTPAARGLPSIAQIDTPHIW